MYNKKVSVIIPFYNNISWLNEALQSVLAQTYKNLEVIVINDGSKESVASILSNYGDSIIYRFQENKGAASARNHGIKISTGDYVAFLDSDDVWLADKIQKQIAFMEATGVKWSHTGYFHWNPRNNSLKSINIKDEYGDVFKKTFVSIRIATPCVMLCSNIFKNHPELIFNEDYRIGQDTKMWQSISRFYPIGLVREPLAKVRLRDDNTFKQSLKIINLKAKEFKLTYRDAETPYVARLRGLMYLTSSSIFQYFPSHNEKLLKATMIPPYIIGRAYVKYLSISNRKYKKFVI